MTKVDGSRYRLRFSPDFSKQKREWLAQEEVPEGPLPRSVERALAAIEAGPEGPVPRTVGAFWGRVFRALLPLLSVAALASLGAAACSVLSTFVAMRILRQQDGVGLGLGLGWMLALAGGYFLCNVTAQGMVFMGGRLRGWVGLAAQALVVGWVSHKLLRLSTAASARQSSGNLKMLVTSDVLNISQFLETVVRNVIPTVCALAVVTPFLVRFSGKAGLFGILVMALLLPISLGLTAISSRLQARSQSEMDRLATLVGEWVKNIRLIRYLSWQDAAAREVSARVRQFMAVSVAQHWMACLIFGLSTTWWMVSITGVVLSSRWLGTELDLIGFFGSLWLMTFLAGTFAHLPNTLRLYGLAAPSVRRIVRLLAEQERCEELKVEESDGPMGADARPVKLCFEDVSFAFGGAAATPGKEAIRGLTAEVDLRRKVAVIGEIGSGKSTFLRLLCGEFPPTSGRILVEFEDGSRRDLWTRRAHEAVRSCLGYVPQEPFVSSDLFSHNIALGGVVTGQETSVVEAAYWAELEADVAGFAGGVSQELGEGGVNLSGGQRQRLNLARARYSGRPYLVLDDTLSAVDPATEIRLMERLSGHPGGFVLVTHRTRELGRVERVFVMSEGRIVECGSPEELARDPRSHYVRVVSAYARQQEVPHE